MIWNATGFLFLFFCGAVIGGALGYAIAHFHFDEAAERRAEQDDDTPSKHNT